MPLSIFAWPKNRATTSRKATRFIVVHCTATPEGRHFDASDIDRWHKKEGWAGIGYHYVVHLDGSIEAGRPEGAVGSHAYGYNPESIGVVYIGGCDREGRPKDTRTPQQKEALKQLLRHLKAKYKDAVIQGHRDFPKVAKACPSFDAKSEYADL